MIGWRGCGRRRAKNVQRPTSNVQRPTTRADFEDALDDDLNISGALGVLFESIRETNRALDLGKLDASEAKFVAAMVGTDRPRSGRYRRRNVTLPPEIAALAEAARAGKACKGLEKK